MIPVELHDLIAVIARHAGDVADSTLSLVHYMYAAGAPDGLGTGGLAAGAAAAGAAGAAAAAPTTSDTPLPGAFSRGLSELWSDTVEILSTGSVAGSGSEDDGDYGSMAGDTP